MNEDRITYFAETDYRNKRTPFGIKASDRSRHVYVIGKTGMGKSTLLENMAIQDIRNGEGMAFIDPHGKTAELLLEYVPRERIDDVVYFAPFDTDNPVAFNVMEDVGPDKRHLVANGLMSAFKKIWEDAWSSRMEYILNNTILALLEYPDATLLGVNKMYTDKEFRKKVVAHIKDPSVKSFWEDEFTKYTDRYTQEATPAIQNKVGQFTSNPLIRNIVGQPKSSFDLRKVMDEKKILIMNLSKGRMGEQNANLLGSMLVTKIYLAAMSRADVHESSLAKLPNFYFFVDEFQSFANESFADILSEARKYKLNLTIAHQYIEQMPEEVRAAVFGNVGTMIVFRIGSYDAEVLEKEFAPRFTAEDIVNLGFAQVYLRLMINGIGSQPFSARTLPPLSKPENSYMEEVIIRSRQKFAHPRAEVEEVIFESLKTVEPERKERPANREERPMSKERGESSSPPERSPTYRPARAAASPGNSGQVQTPRYAPPVPHEQNASFPPQEPPSLSSEQRGAVKARPYEGSKILQPSRPQQQKEDEERSTPLARRSETNDRQEDRPMSLNALRRPEQTNSRPPVPEQNSQPQKPEQPAAAGRPAPAGHSSLRDALFSAIKTHKGNGAEKKEEPKEAKKPEPAQKNSEAPGSDTRADTEHPKQTEKQSEPQEAPKKEEHGSAHAKTHADRPKEIPEDILRAMLEVKE